MSLRVVHIADKQQLEKQRQVEELAKHLMEKWTRQQKEKWAKPNKKAPATNKIK